MQNHDPEPSADRERLVLRRLDQEQLLQLSELVGHLGGKIVGLGPVFRQVVELPNIFIRGPILNARREAEEPRSAGAKGAGHATSLTALFM